MKILKSVAKLGFVKSIYKSLGVKIKNHVAKSGRTVKKIVMTVLKQSGDTFERTVKYCPRQEDLRSAFEADVIEIDFNADISDPQFTPSREAFVPFKKDHRATVVFPLFRRNEMQEGEITLEILEQEEYSSFNRVLEFNQGEILFRSHRETDAEEQLKVIYNDGLIDAVNLDKEDFKRHAAAVKLCSLISENTKEPSISL